MEEKKPEVFLPDKPASEILGMDDRPFFQVNVPKWGCSVWVREPDGVTNNAITASSRDESGVVDRLKQSVKFVIEGCYDRNAKGEFTKKFNPGHANELSIKGDSIVLLAVAISNGKKNEALKN